MTTSQGGHHVRKAADLPVREDERTFSPRVSRKGLSEKEYYRALAKNSQETFRNARIDAKNLGSKHYIWKTCGDSDVCPACSKNQGKKFLFSKAPEGGHPGAGTHCKHGHCRCYAEVVIPR